MELKIAVFNSNPRYWSLLGCILSLDYYVTVYADFSEELEWYSDSFAFDRFDQKMFQKHLYIYDIVFILDPEEPNYQKYLDFGYLKTRTIIFNNKPFYHSNLKTINYLDFYNFFGKENFKHPEVFYPSFSAKTLAPFSNRYQNKKDILSPEAVWCENLGTKNISNKTNLQNILRNYFPEYFKKINVVPKIPLIIHYQWINKENNNNPYHERYQKNIETWKKYNPEFTFIYWNDEKIKNFISKEFPEYSDRFYKISRAIIKADLARIMYLIKFGGVYLDLDFYCCKNLQGLLLDKEIIITEEIPEHCYHHRQLYNGIMATVPNNPFFVGWLKRAFDNILVIEDVMESTGPIGFWRYFLSLENRPKLTDTSLIIPYDNLGKNSFICEKKNTNFLYTLWYEGSGDNWGN